MQAGLEKLISETDHEIERILGVKDIVKEISKGRMMADDVEKGRVTSLYSNDYHYVFPKASSYEETITDFGVLASFAEETKPEKIVFPYDSSLESDPIFQGETEDGDAFKTSALITEVINKIISPIHASYQREMLRLEMKEKQLEDEESPQQQGSSDAKAIPFYPTWNTPYKTNGSTDSKNTSLGSSEIEVNSSNIFDPLISAANEPRNFAHSSEVRPPPDPRPPPSFFLKSKTPLFQSSMLTKNFYDSGIDDSFDDENYPPEMLGKSGYSLKLDPIVLPSGSFQQSSLYGKSLDDPVFKPALQGSHSQPVMPIVPPTQSNSKLQVKPPAPPQVQVQTIKPIPHNQQQIAKPTATQQQQSNQTKAQATTQKIAPPPIQKTNPPGPMLAPLTTKPPTQPQAASSQPLSQKTVPPPHQNYSSHTVDMNAYNYSYTYNHTQFNYNHNYNYPYNYPPRPTSTVVYPPPPVIRKSEHVPAVSSTTTLHSLHPSSLSHQSQPYYPQNMFPPQLPYRPHIHPQVHAYPPPGDNPDDDSLPLIYHYSQHVPVFRPEQFSSNIGETKGHSDYTMSQSPFIEKREYLKRQLQLSPTTKQQFTDFFRLFKLKEKEGFEAAKKFAVENFQHLPPKVHWKVYLEMADLAKRENRFNTARKYYEIVNRIQPYGCKGWLEYAKMEEESGRLHDCTRILADGLYFCPHSESLLVKGIKHSERMDNIDASRALLSRLKNVAIERSWRTIMEGGLLESRQGNLHVARQIFKYLMEKVPSYGPIYTEAVRLEMRMEEYSRGLKLVEKGLQRIPSYGPLWFLAIKLEERLGKDFTKRVEDAVPNLSKELVWKIYFELAQIEERRGNYKNCYKAYVQSVLNCPSRNLVWKVWLGGARTELHRGNVDAARKLLFRALQNVPSKMKATALLECARFEEFLGDLEDARYILRKAKKETRHEWKVFLESVLLEMRANQLDRALTEVNEALDVHSTTGRLWAVLIQLTHLKNLTNDSVSAQTKVFRSALTNVPKSGEVWCEGARIALHQGLLDSARKYLDFAIQFTPQYGDSFIEHLRLEMLCLKTDDIESALEKPETKAALDKLELQCLNAEPTYGVCWTYCKEHPLDSARQCLRNAKRQLIQMAKERSILSKVKLQEMTPEQLRKWKIHETLDIAASFFGEKKLETETAMKEFRFRTIFS